MKYELLYYASMRMPFSLYFFYGRSNTIHTKYPFTFIAYIETVIGRGRVFACNIFCRIYNICIDENVEMKKLRNEENRRNPFGERHLYGGCVYRERISDDKKGS